MRNRGNVFDHGYLKTGGLQGSDGCLSALSRTLYINLNILHAMLHGCSCSCLGSGLRRERSGLFGASESQLACASPRNSVALCIGNSNNCVVECRLDMRCASFDMLTLATTANNLLSTFWFCHNTVPPYFFLLAIVLRGPLRVRALVLER